MQGSQRGACLSSKTQMNPKGGHASLGRLAEPCIGAGSDRITGT